MADDIGYNDGIQAFEDWFRKLSPAIDKHNAWVDAYNTWAVGARTTAPPIPVKFPKIPLEGPAFNEADKNTWPWPRKFFRNTMRKLKDYYDSVNSTPPPPPPPPPTNPWDSGFAPQAYNQGGSGQDARYNIRINCTQRSDGKYVDKQGIVYDDGGRPLGGRTQTAIPELKPADQMDGREPWDIYIYNDVQIGPNKENYPAASYNR